LINEVVTSQSEIMQNTGMFWVWRLELVMMSKRAQTLWNWVIMLQ